MWRVEAPLLSRSQPGWSRFDGAVIVIDGGRLSQVSVSRSLDPSPDRGTGARIAKLEIPAGSVIVPGLRDPHLHLRSMAAARLSVDCSAAQSMTQLLAHLNSAADLRSDTQWLRGWGYDEANLIERRAPSIDELDRACGRRPVVLHHRTGHVAVLNRAALDALGVEQLGAPGRGADGVERSGDGRATGILIEARRLLTSVPALPPTAIDAAVSAVSRRLSEQGVTAVTDATATNGLSDLAELDSWLRRGLVQQRVTALLAASAVADAVSAGVPTLATPSDGASPCRVVGAKISAAAGDIFDQIAHARQYGWPVAVHATEIDELEAALSAIENLGAPAWGRDRIEHLGLALPEQILRLAASGAAVVSNPAFLAERGHKYVENLSSVEAEWLYPVHSLVARGITVAAASDGPVTLAGPLDSARAAVDRVVRRGAAAGQVIARSERVDATLALAMITTAAAELAGDHPSLRRGGAADFTILDRDPRTALSEVGIVATVVAGEITAVGAGLDPSILVPPRIYDSM
ncbi:MAG: amidohydrolase [Microbacteriaceae bacterium]